MSQVCAVKINRKDLYSKKHDETEYVNKEEKKHIKITKSMTDLFIRMIGKN